MSRAAPRRGVGGVASCALALVLAATGVVAETLTDELTSLVQNHPNIRSKAKTVSSFGEAERAARSGYLPTATISGDTGPEYVDSPARRSTEGRAFYKGRESATLQVTQKLFDGYNTDSQVDTTRAQQDSAEADLRATRQAALSEGITAYIEVMKQTRLIALARENERKVQEQLSLEDERVRKGSGMASDVLAAKQRLQIAKERRVNYEGEFETSSSKYNQVFGHSPDVAAMVEPPLPMDLIPTTLEEVLTIAQKENPTIDNASRKIAINQAKIRTSEAGYYPTLDLVGKSDYENDKNATIGVRRDWSVLLQAKWELFSGFKTEAQVAQATWDHSASKDDHLQTSRKTLEQARTAWHKLQTAKQRIGLLENAANIAEEVFEAVKKKREAGKATVQDVLDEETRTNDARINYTIAYYDRYQPAFDLLVAMGRLEVENMLRAKPAAANPAMMPALTAIRTVPAAAEIAPAPRSPAPAARTASPEPPLPRLMAAPSWSAPARTPEVSPGQLPDTSPNAMTEQIKTLMRPVTSEPAYPAAPEAAPVEAAPTPALPDGSPNAMVQRIGVLMDESGHSSIIRR
ncbi:MAG: TolC family outer membrane protein [Magnetospirillum sp.]|nr:TolC family outer membrane protein [Magnetospirillum sp.]